tara:strand:+ start:2943 stop:4046 length:1104 start_codon:yes stop_codon:yes gene_type:complete
MKILNILQGTSLGGMEQSSLTLMKNMQKLGCEFEVLSLTPFGKLKAKLESADINSNDTSYSGIGGWMSFFDIRSKIQSSNADAIMMTGHSLVGMLALGKKCSGKRLLAVHFHHEGVKPKIIWKIIYFIACKKFDHITFASNFIRKEAIEIFPRVIKKSEVINNPIIKKEVQKNEKKVAARKKLGISEDAIVFGNAGWLIKRKRFDIFIKLAKEIKKSQKNAIFLIAGDGAEKENLLHLSKELKISESIIWLGWQDDLEDFYNSLDFMIFNSDWDAVGLSPLESIIKGIFTVVSVKNGGISEILKDDYSYFFHHTHDIEILSKKINYLISNKEESYKLLDSLRSYVIEISDPIKIAKKTMDKYQNEKK